MMISEDFFRSLERQRTAALVQRDMDTAWKLHAPEYQLITPGGKTFTRERYLDGIASGALPYVRWEIGDIAVRMSPAMSIVRYQAQIGFPSGKVVKCWHTDAWELFGDAWRAVWSQATAIQEPAADATTATT